MPKLILASASPRRAMLLREAGYDFDVEPADVDEETIAANLAPGDVPERLARAKLDVVLSRHEGTPVVVLAADTVVRAQDGGLVGKPRDEADAASILRRLSNTRHGVVTGYALARGDGGTTHSGSVRSDVTMRDLRDDEIDAYLATGLWQGKAGAYGIQEEPGEVATFVECIEGELSNVIGLPMPQVVEVLSQLGVRRPGLD